MINGILDVGHRNYLEVDIILELLIDYISGVGRIDLYLF